MYKPRKTTGKKIFENAITMVMYSLLLAVIGCNIFLFAVVCFKLMSGFTVALFGGNLVLFMVMSGMYFKEMERLSQE